MDKFGLIGDPVATSLSPLLFEAAYHGEYAYDLIEGNDFDKSFEKFFTDYKAINVTAPFKEKAFLKADVFSAICLKIKAVNILLKTDEGICGGNSDFTGIILSLAEAYLPGITNQFYEKFGDKAYIQIHKFLQQSLGSLFDRRPQALIVGCGGAGRAAAIAAAELGFATVLMNRTPDKAQSIADELPEYGFIADPLSDFRAAFRECDLVIYTVPSAIDALASLSEDDFRGEDRYKYSRPAKVVLEANYKTPSFSGSLRQRMLSTGCQYVPGQSWLLNQALTGYGLMTGLRPDSLSMTRAILA